MQAYVDDVLVTFLWPEDSDDYLLRPGASQNPFNIYYVLAAKTLMRRNIRSGAVEGEILEAFQQLVSRTEMVINVNAFLGLLNGIVPESPADEELLLSIKEHFTSHLHDFSPIVQTQLSRHNSRVNVMGDKMTIAYQAAVTTKKKKATFFFCLTLIC